MAIFAGMENLKYDEYSLYLRRQPKGYDEEAFNEMLSSHDGFRKALSAIDKRAHCFHDSYIRRFVDMEEASKCFQKRILAHSVLLFAQGIVIICLLAVLLLHIIL